MYGPKGGHRGGAKGKYKPDRNEEEKMRKSEQKLRQLKMKGDRLTPEESLEKFKCALESRGACGIKNFSKYI